jgi:bacterioferritin-associated ferredoxin
MFVCQCGAVTDREIVAAIDDGADTVETIGAETGAGTGCGGCHESIRKILDEHCATCPRVALTVVA